MKRLFIVLSAIVLFCSCEFIDRAFNGEIVARVGKSVLYKSDISGLVPSGTTPEDSAFIVSQYIHSWATKKLLMSNAESRLSRKDRDVEQEIDDFRTTLLVYRYEKLYVERNLDTLITEEECKRYYESNRENFKSQSSVVKGRFIKINKTSPNYQKIKNLYRSTKIEDMDAVGEMCMNSAEKFTDFQQGWVPLSVVAKEMGADLQSCEDQIARGGYMEVSDEKCTCFLKVYERVPAGEITPYEYNINVIRESILSKRKQELVTSLERNLLEEALNTDKLKIYSDDNDK